MLVDGDLAAERDLAAVFAAAAGLAEGASYRQVIDAVHAMPYGRPAVRSARGAIAEWRGTCSTKHALLAELLAGQWPQLRPRLVHRVCLVTRQSAAARFGVEVAAAVPPGGLTDVHRYLLISLDGTDVVIDVTFPADPRWDGARSMRLACGDGKDFAAGPTLTWRRPAWRRAPATPRCASRSLPHWPGRPAPTCPRVVTAGDPFCG